MTKQRRDRAKTLTNATLRELNAAIRQHERDHHGATKYSLEKLGELTGLDPETVGKVLSRQGNDKRILERCCGVFGITLTQADYIPVSQVTPSDIDPSFVGREEAIAHLHELVKRNAKIIVIQARGGVGKTTLARRFLHQEFAEVLEFPIAKETKDIASIESLLEEKLRQLGEEPGREFLVSCDRLKCKLQRNCIGILIDNLEPALDSAGRFIEPHRRYVEVLRILADPSVQSTTLITSRERVRESSITVETYLLKSLDLTAWQVFFASRSLATDTPALVALHNAYGGNAKAMEIICGAIAQDFEGDVDDYWQENQDDLFMERDLEDLVKQQFERLKTHHLDAYNLLCRMGCYRYQDVPTVPVEGLFCLMWDVPEKEHKRVVKVLRDRSLVEVKDSNNYSLHPVLRTEALSLIRQSTSWEKTNRQAAQVWSNNVLTVESTDDALRALESYHHYVAIGCYREAANTLIQLRKNNWLYDSETDTQLSCTLGSSLVRLGLCTQVTSNILEVCEHLENEYPLNKIYSILGDNYWMMGNINRALKYHGLARDLAQQIECKELEIIAIFDLGLCKEALWYFEESIDSYDQVIKLAEGTQYRRYATQSRYALANVYACLDNAEKAALFLEKSLSELRTTTLGIRSTGYRLYALGFTLSYLGRFGEADEMYSRSLEYSRRGRFLHLEGISVQGYAILRRDQKKFEDSLCCHRKAIEVFEKLGGKIDIAKAYYLLSQTQKLAGFVSDGCINLKKAIDLFKEVSAFKYIKIIQQGAS